jgi:beta-glucan synthesis-associated protein KRE6
MPGHWDLVDKDTPELAHTRKSLNDEDEDLVLVFSDEFNVNGRTFYPGEL